MFNQHDVLLEGVYCSLDYKIKNLPDQEKKCPGGTSSLLDYRLDYTLHTGSCEHDQEVFIVHRALHSNVMGSCMLGLVISCCITSSYQDHVQSQQPPINPNVNMPWAHTSTAVLSTTSTEPPEQRFERFLVPTSVILSCYSTSINLSTWVQTCQRDRTGDKTGEVVV